MHTRITKPIKSNPQSSRNNQVYHWEQEMEILTNIIGVKNHCLNACVAEVFKNCSTKTWTSRIKHNKFIHIYIIFFYTHSKEKLKIEILE